VRCYKDLKIQFFKKKKKKKTQVGQARASQPTGKEAE
jgi:hypothetical protein